MDGRLSDHFICKKLFLCITLHRKFTNKLESKVIHIFITLVFAFLIICYIVFHHFLLNTSEREKKIYKDETNHTRNPWTFPKMQFNPIENCTICHFNLHKFVVHNPLLYHLPFYIKILQFFCVFSSASSFFLHFVLGKHTNTQKKLSPNFCFRCFLLFLMTFIRESRGTFSLLSKTNF